MTAPHPQPEYWLTSEQWRDIMYSVVGISPYQSKDPDDMTEYPIPDGEKILNFVRDNQKYDSQSNGGYIITEDELGGIMFVAGICPISDVEKVLAAEKAIRSRPHSTVSNADVLDEVIKIIHKKVQLPTNSGEQISCDASIRLGIIHDIKEQLLTRCKP